MPKPATLLLGMVLCFAPTCMHAQQLAAKATDTAAHYYRLTFIVQELSDTGKITNSRSYTTTIGSGNSFQQIRSGSKIPIPTGDKGELQYLDIGFEADCSNARESDSKLAMNITATLSSLANTNADPVIRQNSWKGNLAVSIGKPQAIFSADDLDSKGSIQISVTAVRAD